MPGHLDGIVARVVDHVGIIAFPALEIVDTCPSIEAIVGHIPLNAVAQIVAGSIHRSRSSQGQVFHIGAKGEID